MIENKLKRLLQAGGTAIGTMVCDTRNPAIARALAAAGFDYFILDTEHGSFGLETVSDIMQMARLEGITPSCGWRTSRIPSSRGRWTRGHGRDGARVKTHARSSRSWPP